MSQTTQDRVPCEQDHPTLNTKVSTAQGPHRPEEESRLYDVTELGQDVSTSLHVLTI